DIGRKSHRFLDAQLKEILSRNFFKIFTRRLRGASQSIRDPFPLLKRIECSKSLYEATLRSRPGARPGAARLATSAGAREPPHLRKVGAKRAIVDSDPWQSYPEGRTS